MTEEAVTRPPAHGLLTPDQILLGPPITPEQRISLYSPGDFELFVRDWAYYHLQLKEKSYTRVVRTGAAGDLGRDVVGYRKHPPSDGDYDIYQCKHYPAPLTPGNMWIEFGKICWHTFNGSYRMPGGYYFVAPRDLGPSAEQLLEDPERIRSALLSDWKKHCEAKLSAKQTIPLSAELRAHIEGFDFRIFRHKPLLEVVEELRHTPCYAPRFGGGLQLPAPTDPVPPEEIAPFETRYIEQLLEAYRDDKKESSLDLDHLSKHRRYQRHFERSRERFYCAEALERFARDALAGGPGFPELQDLVHDSVVDICDSQYASGLDRVIAVTSQSAQVQVVSHPLRRYTKSKNMAGICHQLANVDRLVWVRSEEDSS